LSADDVIAMLDLKPHPEGGHFRETFRDAAGEGDRAASTAIYFLLAAGETSHWHRIDAAEVWHWYAGAPLELSLAPPQGIATRIRLGQNLAACAQLRRVDADRLYSLPRVHVRAVRVGRGRLRAAGHRLGRGLSCCLRGAAPTFPRLPLRMVPEAFCQRIDK
jgi:hypothetical protein